MRDQIEQLVREELARANAKFPGFASHHEAYAVLLEEVEELGEALELMKCGINDLWDIVRGKYTQVHYFKTTNEEQAGKSLGYTKGRALDIAEEAVQVAAMCCKWLQLTERG